MQEIITFNNSAIIRKLHEYAFLHLAIQNPSFEFTFGVKIVSEATKMEVILLTIFYF